MKQVSVYDVIKKQNGEHFAKSIRNYNNGIFDIPNIVNIVKYAGHEAEPIMNYLVSLMNIEIKETKYEDPFVLLKKAGYNAYYADTLEKQNAISKYFEKDEKLCTFRDNTRFERYYIINAVKENVDDIKRENFTNPKREDEYGTSVISIQILKNGGFISIKNRYNHTVENPDNTFNSNPDSIINGLSYSLKKYFNVNFSSQNVTLPDNYIFIKNQLVKYDNEIFGYYFGDGYYVKDGKITEINKQTEVMMDACILNLKDRTVVPIIKNHRNASDPKSKNKFEDEAKVFQKEIENKKIQIVKNEDKTKSILLDGKEFVRLDSYHITRLTLRSVDYLPPYFLSEYSSELQYLDCPNVEYVHDDVLFYNSTLTYLDLPKTRIIEKGVLFKNNKIKSINLPNVLSIGDYFLTENSVLESINLPAVEKIGNACFYDNKVLEQLNLPKAKFIGDTFLTKNNKIKSINLPNVLSIGSHFLSNNSVLESINLPVVEEIGSSSFYNIRKTILKEIYMPNIKDIETDGFFYLIYADKIENLKHQYTVDEIIKRNRFYYNKEYINEINELKFYSKER